MELVLFLSTSAKLVNSHIYKEKQEILRTVLNRGCLEAHEMRNRTTLPYQTSLVLFLKPEMNLLCPLFLSRKTVDLT